MNHNILKKHWRTVYRMSIKIGRIDDVISWVDKVDINTRIEDNSTILIAASCLGKNKIVRQLLKKERIWINAKMNGGTTALMMASHFGYNKIVKMLLEAGAKTNIESDEEFTALSIAKNEKVADMIRDYIPIENKKSLEYLIYKSIW